MKIDLENEFQNYLRMVGLDTAPLPEYQLTEMRRAFMGGCGQLLVLFRDVMGTVPDQKTFDLYMKSMISQLTNFWTVENKKYESKNN